MADYPGPDATREQIEAWKRQQFEKRFGPVIDRALERVLDSPADRLVAEMAAESRVEAVLKKPRRCSACNRTGHVKGHCPPCESCGAGGHWLGSKRCPNYRTPGRLLKLGKVWARP